MWVGDDAVPQAHAQLVWANMALHWSVEPRVQFAAWHRALQPDGFLMFSCFGPDTLKALHAAYRRLGVEPPGHAFIDMHDLGDALLASGFAEPVMDMESIRLHWAEPTGLMTELRTLGGNASWRRAAGLRTPRRHARLLERIGQELAGPQGRPELGFEIVYGHAFRAAPRLAVARETKVPLETLRTMARGPRGRPPQR